MMNHLKYSDKNLGKAAAIMPFLLSIMVAIGFAGWIVLVENDRITLDAIYFISLLGVVNLLFSYIVTAIIAMPLLLIIKRLGFINLLSILFITILSGYIVSLCFSSSFPNFRWNDFNKLGILVGFLGGITYYLLVNYFYHKSRKRDAT